MESVEEDHEESARKERTISMKPATSKHKICAFVRCECDDESGDKVIGDDSDDSDDLEFVPLFDLLSPEEIADLDEIMHMFFDDYIAEYAINMSDPDFKHNMCVELAKSMYHEMNWLDICTADHIAEIRDWVEMQCDIYYDFADIPQRQQDMGEDEEQNKNANANANANTNANECIAYIRSIPQSKQRSQEWYDERDNMITASSVWKIFASDAQRNSLIYEKCRVNNNTNKRSVGGIPNSNNPMQWGAKYEPISRDMYSMRHGGIAVEEYGCIPHRQYAFLGASPDGITETGRMLEIKNIVNREITGEPLEAYWIQMQIQMEVCGLDVCDFVETRFKEFDSEIAFYSSKQKQKGVILHFVSQQTGDDYQTEYVYYQLDMPVEETAISEWTEKEQAKREQSVLYYTYYWWLDEYSECVVKRNRLWFEAAIPEIEECWTTIVREREEGFGHRAPASRKDAVASLIASICLDECEMESHKINCVIPNYFMDIVKLDR